jgi:hypothetical protein
MADQLNIYQKLIEVRKAVPYLQKEHEGEQYKYVSSSQVLSKVRDEMDKQGLLLIPKITGTKVAGDMVEKKDKYGNTKHTTTYFTEISMEYTWVNSEKPEETIVCPWYGQGVDIAGEKGVGKALTYAEKYFLLKFFNIATDKDDPDSFQSKLDGSDGDKGSKKDEITENEVNAMFDLGKTKGVSVKGIKNTIMKQFNKTEVKNLTMAEYDKLYRSIEKISKPEGQSNER